MIILSILDLNILDLILNFFDIYDFIEIIFLGFGMGALTSYIYYRFWKKWTTLGNSEEDNNEKSVLFCLLQKEDKYID